MANDKAVILTGPQKSKISVKVVCQILGQKRAEAIFRMHFQSVIPLVHSVANQKPVFGSPL